MESPVIIAVPLRCARRHPTSAAASDGLDAQGAWGGEWRSAAFSSEYLAPLTAEELAALSDELHRLVKRYEAAGRAAEDAGDTEGRENVALHLYGFPFRA